MTTEAPSLDLAGLERALALALALHPPRAFIAIVHAPPELLPATEALLAAQLAASAAAVRAAAGAAHQARASAAPGAPAGVAAAMPELIVVRVTDDVAGRERLGALNVQRDVLLRAVGAIVLQVTSEPEARALRRWAPDLTAAPDLWVRVAAPGAVRPWPEIAVAIRAWMVAEHRDLDLTGLVPATSPARRRPLDEVYAPLVDLTATATTAANPDPGRDRDEPGRGWLILGGPGTGKTTFLRHTALRLARGEDALGHGPLLPVVVPLAEYGLYRERRAATTLVAWTGRWLAERGVAGAETLGEHLGEVALLLDGLDEVRDAGARRAVLAEMAALIGQRCVGAVIIGARSFVVDELGPSELRALRVVSPRAPDDAWVRALVTRLAWRPDGAAGRLADRILEDRDLRHLARTPLLATLLVVLHETEGRLPEREVEVYLRLGERLTESWAQVHALGPDAPRHGHDAALRVLGPLAWWALERGGAPIPEAELLYELVALESLLAPPAEAERHARALLERWRTDAAGLARRADGRWQFAHRSIAEYLAAADADRDPARWQQLTLGPFDPALREVVILAIAHASVVAGRYERAEELIEAVLRHARRRGRYDARHAGLLAGVLEARPELGDRHVRALAKRMLELALGRVYPRESARAVQRDAAAVLLALAWTREGRALGAALAPWFRPGRDWTKALRASAVTDAEVDALRPEDPPPSDSGEAYLRAASPPFLSLLGPLAEAHRLDPGPLLEDLAASSSARLRLVAAWQLAQRAVAAGVARSEFLADPRVAPFAGVIAGALRERDGGEPSPS